MIKSKVKKLSLTMLLGSVFVLLLSGCESIITTELQVIGPGKVASSITIKLDELSSEAVVAKPQLDQQIMSTMSTISSQPVKRLYKDNMLVYTVRAVPSELPGDIIGVSNVAVGVKGDNLVTSLQLTTPSKLIESLNKSFEGEPDAAALSLTWQKSIKLNLTIETPGDIVVYSPYFTVNKNKASMEANLVNWPVNETVSLESSPAGSNLVIIILIVGVVLIVIFGVILFVRKTS
jgi:uncharacterized protein YceK